MKTATFQMRNALDAVDDMVLTLKAHAGTTLPTAVLVRFEICAAEVLANIVKHAQSDAEFEITLTPTATKLIAEFFDPQDAAPFDLRDHARDLDSIEPMAETGRGLGLILQCADRVDYGISDGRTRLSLIFFSIEELQV